MSYREDEGSFDMTLAEALAAARKRHLEATRLAGRRKALRQWSTASPDELIRVLEERDYPSFTGKDYDSSILIDHLWALHRDELTPERQEKIRLLIDTGNLSPKASFHRNAYCVALQGDSGQLSEMWRSEFDSKGSFDALSVLMECSCHIQTQDLRMIHDIIGIVHQPAWLFGARFKAMISVAGLDAARKTNAAEVIRNAVHNSTPQIIASRDRAIERLTGEAARWRRCETCCYGQIHSDFCAPVSCPVCLGFGTVPD
jgi:hypothetical protein